MAISFISTRTNKIFKKEKFYYGSKFILSFVNINLNFWSVRFIFISMCEICQVARNQSFVDVRMLCFKFHFPQKRSLITKDLKFSQEILNWYSWLMSPTSDREVLLSNWYPRNAEFSPWVHPPAHVDLSLRSFLCLSSKLA